MRYLIIAATALAAGFIQGVAGFGSGPIQMMTYPLLFPLPTAAAVSVCCSIPLNADMLLTYRREIRWKKALLPVLPYLAICSAAISASKYFDQALMKKIFGAFLILLAAYYLFLNHGRKKPLSRPRIAAYIAISALCDALFGIGGPLMVLYFLNRTDSTREYMGTVAAFFLVNGVYSTLYRLGSGILAPPQLPAVLTGVVFILLGVTAAHRLVSRLDDARLKRITYVMIGVTGILNLLS